MTASRHVEGYQPHFAREGTTRRVLGHITDLDHVGRGPRNTLARLAQELAEDPHTDLDGDPGTVRQHLDRLQQAGLVAQRDDGTYRLTEAGHVELAN